MSLLSTQYKGLVYHLQSRAKVIDSNIGKVVVLPLKFIGSPENMMQLYHDPMAIVEKFGTSDLFITMTCNPQWEGIKKNVLSDQNVSDKSELVARVFFS